MKQALLIVDHGSRREEAHESLEQVAALVRASRPDLIVHIAHMSISEPNINQGYAACVADGGTEIIVHPYFLANGSHAKDDIPELVKQAALEYPETSFRVSEPLGVHGKLADLILERARPAPTTTGSPSSPRSGACMTHVALHVERLDDTIDFYRDYCGMNIVHERTSGDKRIVWMAEPGRETDFIFVIMNGGRVLEQASDHYSHFGFALESREAVDAVAAKAREAGLLFWEPRQEPYPVGYYCGVRTPEGSIVEFSHGQPLGPGAPDFEHKR